MQAKIDALDERITNLSSRVKALEIAVLGAVGAAQEENPKG